MTSKISLEAARRLRPNLPYHLPPSAQPVHSSVELTLEGVHKQPDVVCHDSLRDVVWRVGMAPAGNDTWKAQLLLPSEPTVLRYHFETSDNQVIREQRQFEGRNKPIYDEWVDREFQIAVYDPAAMPADWTRGMIIYQIFPDRFAHKGTAPTLNSSQILLKWNALPENPPYGRDFYGGNLAGLIDKLDYIADLGIECIYLTPIFTSPSNHRYDTIDYLQIDPLLGSEAEFDHLIERAHQLGLRIILDAVFNHCSDKSIYFKEARHSRQSRFYSWFVFSRWPDQYAGWANFNHMPEFVECPDVEDYFLGPSGVTAHWLRHKIDGYRTDVTRWISDEYWRRFRKTVHSANPQAYLVAEEWEDASHYLVGDMYDATMNYRFSWAVHGFIAYDRLTPSELDDRLETWMRDTPPPALLSQMNLLDSHDTWRILTTCGGDKRRMKQMVAFQLAYAGAPMIYYGDEAGLEGDNAESGRRAFPWDHLDQEIYPFYRHAIHQRRALPALRYGSVESVVIDDDQRAYAFVRRYETQAVYAVFNASDVAATVTIPLADGESGEWKDALGAHPGVGADGGQLRVTIEPRGAAWYTR